MENGKWKMYNEKMYNGKCIMRKCKMRKTRQKLIKLMNFIKRILVS